jgi:hemerythrin superfamily protein
MGKATAKVKAAASKVGAALTGKVGILSTLEGEHTEVSSLMSDVRDAKETDKQRDLYQAIRQDLLIHAQGEEQGLYSECRAHESTRALADKAIQDHTQIKQILAAIDELTLGSPDWARKFDELESTVQRHVEFEENQLFPAAKEALGSDALRDLDGRYKAHRKRVEGQQLDPRMSQTG